MVAILEPILLAMFVEIFELNICLRPVSLSL